MPLGIFTSLQNRRYLLIILWRFSGKRGEGEKSKASAECESRATAGGSRAPGDGICSAGCFFTVTAYMHNEGELIEKKNPPD